MTFRSLQTRVVRERLASSLSGTSVSQMAAALICD